MKPYVIVLLIVAIWLSIMYVSVKVSRYIDHHIYGEAYIQETVCQMVKREHLKDPSLCPE
jgi:hypothetical protein